jgi:hypothetical protein
MRSTQITTWRRYTAAEKKAYRARVRRRALDELFSEMRAAFRAHHFADNLGSRVPTMRVNGDVL